jgi:hypothetical protein
MEKRKRKHHPITAKHQTSEREAYDIPPPIKI